MMKKMCFRVAEPTRLVLDREVTYVQAEDPSGRFGILPGHEAYLTALVPSVLIYRYEENGEKEAYIAVRQGVLRVTKEGVEVAARQAHRGSSLTELQEAVREARQRTGERSYRSTRSLYGMQIAAWRRLMEYEDVRVR